MTAGMTPGMTPGMTLAMTPAQRAFLDTQAALSVWRASKDAEAQVAHWLIEGRAARADLIEYRARTKTAHDRYRTAHRAYMRACETFLTQG